MSSDKVDWAVSVPHNNKPTERILCFYSLKNVDHRNSKFDVFLYYLLIYMDLETCNFRQLCSDM